jgi:NAD(P)-dependent dehydrogenase (short-subunit alcohol dehydrogenase family)
LFEQIAVVSGGNRGIGFEVVSQLAQRGYDVVLGSRDPQSGAAAARTLDLANVHVAHLDVARSDSVNRLAAALQRDFGRVDVLVNNAAILYDTWQTAREADLDIVRQALETNLFGAWRLTQALLPLLRESNHARIVNVSSQAASLEGMAGGEPAYSTSKVALNALTRMLADELASDRILVNSVCPGWTATDMGGAGGRPVAQGAASIVWAATLNETGPTGGFFRDGKPLPW